MARFVLLRFNSLHLAATLVNLGLTVFLICDYVLHGGWNDQALVPSTQNLSPNVLFLLVNLFMCFGLWTSPSFWNSLRRLTLWFGAGAGLLCTSALQGIPSLAGLISGHPINARTPARDEIVYLIQFLLALLLQVMWIHRLCELHNRPLADDRLWSSGRWTLLVLLVLTLLCVTGVSVAGTSPCWYDDTSAGLPASSEFIANLMQSAVLGLVVLWSTFWASYFSNQGLLMALFVFQALSMSNLGWSFLATLLPDVCPTWVWAVMWPCVTLQFILQVVSLQLLLRRRKEVFEQSLIFEEVRPKRWIPMLCQLFNTGFGICRLVALSQTAQFSQISYAVMYYDPLFCFFSGLVALVGILTMRRGLLHLSLVLVVASIGLVTVNIGLALAPNESFSGFVWFGLLIAPILQNLFLVPHLVHIPLLLHDSENETPQSSLLSIALTVIAGAGVVFYFIQENWSQDLTLWDNVVRPAAVSILNVMGFRAYTLDLNLLVLALEVYLSIPLTFSVVYGFTSSESSLVGIGTAVLLFSIIGMILCTLELISRSLANGRRMS